MTTIYGEQGVTIGLLDLKYRTVQGEPFQLVQYLFTLISPDKNPAD
jgi:hypothetical protein